MNHKTKSITLWRNGAQKMRLIVYIIVSYFTLAKGLLTLYLLAIKTSAS